MKKSFATRRVPRKVGSDEDEPTDSLSSTSNDRTSNVKRPSMKTKRSTQVQRFSAATDDEEDAGSGVITPKRTNLSRIALQRSAGQKASFLAHELPRTPDEADDDAPTYSAADLQALKASTPSTPQPDPTAIAEQDRQALDFRDKFGTSLAMYEQQQRGSAIPSAAEIAEKKARRARLALESKADEYISLDPDDPGWQEDDDGNMMRDGDGRLVLREKDKYKIQESRLVRDDEDIMEGFDEYTGDTGSKIAMGASTRPDDKQARRQDIAAQIAQAEDGSDGDESDADEKMRNAAFEAAQARHGTYAADAVKKHDKYAEYRATIPPIITPLPDLDAVVKRLRSTLTDMEHKKRAKEVEMDLLTKEKFRIRDEEVRVQTQLQDVAEKFRLLKIEKGYLPADTISNVNEPTVEAVTADTIDDNDHDDYDDRPRLGLGGSSLAASTGMTSS